MLEEGSQRLRIGIDARWIPPESSGVGIYTRELLRHLAHLDTENHYVLFFESRSLRIKTMAELGLNEARNFSTFMLPYGLYAVANQLFLPACLRRLSIDVFHSPDCMIPLLAFPRDRAGKVRCVVTLHDVVPLAIPDFSPRSRKNRLRPIYRLMMIEVGRRADVIVTDSDASRATVVEHLQIPPSRTAAVKRVYGGVSERFKPPAAGMGGNTDDNSRMRTILYVGRSDPYKGVVDLVDAFALLLRTCPFPVRLRIVGSRDKRYPEAPERARELGADAFIEWMGYLTDDDMVITYQRADVLVLPSRCEGFGLPVVEAMACGTPVVCSRVGSLPEVAGDAARYVEPGDADGLAAELRRVLTDPSLRAEMVERGLSQARRFTWEKTARDMLAVYREVAARR